MYVLEHLESRNQLIFRGAGRRPNRYVHTNDLPVDGLKAGRIAEESANDYYPPITLWDLRMTVHFDGREILVVDCALVFQALARGGGPFKMYRLQSGGQSRGEESGSKLSHSKASHAPHTRKTLDNSALFLFQFRPPRIELIHQHLGRFHMRVSIMKPRGVARDRKRPHHRRDWAEWCR